MPRNVRNWWVEGTVDGRGPVKLGGPQAADGGFRLTVNQRDAGEVKTALRLRGWVGSDGILRLDIEQGDLPWAVLGEQASVTLSDVRVSSKR